ncbi:flagellar biosynthesis protein FliR [Lachnospiraceae bacterium KM106-2]|nr:flagellar biosynthesis protein FliR [Lachnospiraceae bacterium KM106-2]
MSFTIDNVEFYLLVLVRMSGFIFSAPIFSLGNIPRKYKVGISVIFTIIVCSVIPYEKLSYSGTIGFAGLVTKELLVGVIIGYMANICSHILTFSGNIIDMEIGFSMMQELNPLTKVQTTITGRLYSTFVTLIMLTTYFHHYLIKAIVSTYTLIPLGKVSYKGNLYTLMTKFIVDFFVIGFRIVLPVFACILIVNIVLGILARVAPQMNMFVIGMQLKVFVGLIVIFVVINMLPTVSMMIMNEMRELMKLSISIFKT